MEPSIIDEPIAKTIYMALKQLGSPLAEQYFNSVAWHLAKEPEVTMRGQSIMVKVPCILELNLAKQIAAVLEEQVQSDRGHIILGERTIYAACAAAHGMVSFLEEKAP